MLLEAFAPEPDAVEVHEIEIAAPADVVYRTLLTVDLGSCLVVKALMALRSLPEFLLHPGRQRRAPARLTIDGLIGAGFGQLAEEPNREIVLGATGRCWRPTGNILPFDAGDFRGPVRPGVARAVWNFSLGESGAGRTVFFLVKVFELLTRSYVTMAQASPQAPTEPEIRRVPAVPWATCVA